MNKAEVAVSMYDSKPRITARIDLESIKTVKEVELGETISVTIRGKVCSMRGGEESMYKDEKGKTHKSKYPGTLELEIASLTVVSPGEFDGMED
jgi:hypothetical protein